MIYNSFKIQPLCIFLKIFHPNLSLPAFDYVVWSSKDFCFAKGKAKIMKLYSRKNKGGAAHYFQIENILINAGLAPLVNLVSQKINN